MNKESTAELNDLRPEYDLSQLKGGVRGKYYRRAASGTNLVLIEPDLAILFPSAEAVNRALRVLAEAAKSTTFPSAEERGRFTTDSKASGGGTPVRPRCTRRPAGDTDG
jgi:hypothetical protein